MAFGGIKLNKELLKSTSIMATREAALKLEEDNDPECSEDHINTLFCEYNSYYQRNISILVHL